MSEKVLLAIVGIVPGIVAAGVSAISAYFAYKAHMTSIATREIAERTEENTNHLKDELVAEVRSASFAAGRKQEKEAGQ
jgi:hypothetical protein